MGIFRQIFLMSCTVGTISASFLRELYSSETNELLYGSLNKFWELAIEVDFEPKNLTMMPVEKMLDDTKLEGPPTVVEAFHVVENDFRNLSRRVGMASIHDHPIVSKEKMADANGVWIAWFTFNRAKFWQNSDVVGTGVTLIKYNVGIKDAEDNSGFLNWTINDYEELKKAHMWSAAYEFLVHSRYHLYKALRQRQPYRTDIRYKMGYLFYRLRRIMYDLYRVLNVAVRQDIDDEYWVDLNGLLKLYEKFKRLDIDQIDTIARIREEHKKDMDY